jgi:hypothetical protein
MSYRRNLPCFQGAHARMMLVLLTVAWALHSAAMGYNSRQDGSYNIQANWAVGRGAPILGMGAESAGLVPGRDRRGARLRPELRQPLDRSRRSARRGRSPHPQAGRSEASPQPRTACSLARTAPEGCGGVPAPVASTAPSSPTTAPLTATAPASPVDFDDKGT